MAYTKEQREIKKAAESMEIEDSIAAENIVENKEVAPKDKKLNIKNISMSENVWVYSNCYGGLEYISKTGYSVKWDDFKSRQQISLSELINMKNTQRAFFENNWILISDFSDPEYESLFSVEEILDFLQVRKYYSIVLCPVDLEEVFGLSPDEIEKRVPNMSNGVKNAITIRANDLIKNGELDSLKKIISLEKALKCELSRP